LAAAGQRSDPAAAVDRGAPVVATAQLGLAGVDPDPDLDRRLLRPALVPEPALDLEGGGDGGVALAKTAK
jgi:hypothetical protein